MKSDLKVLADFFATQIGQTVTFIDGYEKSGTRGVKEIVRQGVLKCRVNKTLFDVDCEGDVVPVRAACLGMATGEGKAALTRHLRQMQADY